LILLKIQSKIVPAIGQNIILSLSKNLFFLLMTLKLIILTLIPVIEIAFQPLEIPDYRDFKLFDIQFIVDKRNVILSLIFSNVH
jgi:hypothetical protein